MTTFSKLLLFIYTGVITVLSLIPNKDMNFATSIWDKSLHVIAYSFFSILLCLATRHTKHRLLGLVLYSIYGIFIEALQSLSPDRHASVGDVIANTIGLLLGITVALLTQQLLLSYRYKKSS